MTPAAAATPFMTSRLSIFGEPIPSGQHDRIEQTASQPGIHPFDVHNFRCGGRRLISECRRFGRNVFRVRMLKDAMVECQQNNHI